MNVSSDGAGEVKLTVTIPALGLRWLPGKPTAQWIKPWLPEDVKLTAFKVIDNKKTTFTDPQGKKHEVDALTFSSTFAFKNANDLSKIRIQPDDRNQIAASGGATPGKESGMMMAPRKTRPDIGPFQNVTFLKENETIHFRRVLQVARKSSEVDASMMKTPGSDATPQSFDLGNSTHSITIKCPGKILEHNAHSANGTTLTWKFKLKELQKKQDRDWVIEFKCRAENQK